jgi:hypothetical protein
MRFLKNVLATVAVSILVAGCSSPLSLKWTEDVRLPDGRVITLTRYQQYLGATEIGQPWTESDYWLKFRNPDTGETVRWESDRDLKTVALLIHQRVPYLLTMPGFAASINRLKCPSPIYLLFRYSDSQWIRVALTDIPVKRIRSNMTAHMAERVRKTRPKHLTVEQTENSYVLNDKPWLIDFTGLKEQSFDPVSCNRDSDYRLVEP